MKINLPERYLLTMAFTGIILIISCQQPVIPIVIDDPATNKMKFLPSDPTIRDEIKLVIYDESSCNTLSGITRDGNTVHIVKQFNSMMMRPCFLRNDTIIIGKLPPGGYIINYKLLDVAHTPFKIVSSLYFNLSVIP